MTGTPKNIGPRRLSALAALAFILRASCAVVTEHRPLFPAYYYTDARLTQERAAAELVELQAGGSGVNAGHNLSERLQVFETLEFYRAFGARPLFVKLFDAALGALGVAALAAAFATVFTAEAALWAGAGVALWPSHVFFMSQNLKEAPTQFFAAAALAALLTLGFRPPSSGARSALLAAAGFLGLLGLGFYRPLFLLALASLLFATFVWKARCGPSRRGLSVMIPVVFAVVFCSRMSSRLFDALHGVRPGPAASAAVASAVPRFPFTPAGLAGVRRWRQAGDSSSALLVNGRRVATLIYPDADFRRWSDVVLFVPKATFSVLFMPLPGFYPMDGKIGRMLAAAENVVLLCVVVLAAVGVARGPKTAPRGFFAALFIGMAIGASLLEYDLGGAARHKLIFLPFCFPFAAEVVLRSAKRRRG